MNKTVRRILFVVIALIALVAIALLAHQAKSKSALEKYKAELRAKGEKFTFAELAASYTTNANNSMAVITNAANTLRATRTGPGNVEFRKYAAPGQATLAWESSEPSFWTERSSRTDLTNWVSFAADMDLMESTLEKVREAMKDPAADMGMRTNIFDFPKIFVQMRVVAQWLSGATMNELHRKNLDEALKNIEALAGLSRLHRDEYTLVNGMIQVAIAKLGLVVTWEALQASDWTEPQLARLQKTWENVDLVDALEKGLVGERVFGNACIDVVRGEFRGSEVEKWTDGYFSTDKTVDKLVMNYAFLPAYRLTSINDDELFHLRQLQESIEAIRQLETNRPWMEIADLLNTNLARFDKVARSSLGRLRYWFSSIGIPNHRRAAETTVHGETERQMTIAVIALKRFELRHGKLPATFGALAPEFLTELPRDFMSGKPLRYRLNADGSFLLYSVGDDGKDDGGDPNPSKPGDKPDLWSGRDAVWPVASTNKPIQVLRP